MIHTHTHTGYTAHGMGKKIKTASSTSWLLTTVAVARQWWKVSVCVSERARERERERML